MNALTTLRRIAVGAFVALLALSAGAANVALKPQTGSITTQDLSSSSGNCTASSCVVMDISTAGAVAVQIPPSSVYTVTGGLKAAITTNWVDWVILTDASTFTRVSNKTTSATITSGQTGIYQVSGLVAGTRGLKIFADGAVTGDALVTISPAEPPVVGSSSGSGGDASATNQTAVQTPVAPGAATATKGVLGGGQYNAAGVTLTDGQQAAAQMNASGALQVNEAALQARFGTVAASSTNTARLPVSLADSLVVGFSDNTGAVTFFTQDATGYGCVSVQVKTATSGTWTPTVSNDNATFVPISGFTVGPNSAANVTQSGTSTGMYVFPRKSQYFRLARSGGGANLMDGTVLFLRNDCGLAPVPVQTTIAEDVAAGSGDQGYPILNRRDDTLLNNTSATGDYQAPVGNKWGAALSANYQQHAKSYTSTVNVAVAASATDVATICGQATTPTSVTRVLVSGVQTTAGLVDVQLIKRSTANSGGTSGAGVAIPLDSGDSAANSAVLGYTANPTTGTGLGNLRRAYVPIGAATSLSTPTEFAFGDRIKPVRLLTTSECLAVNLAGVTVTGGTLNVTFDWIELP